METEQQLETRNKKEGTPRWRRQVMLFAPLLIWIGVILFLGSGQGASNQTSMIIRPLLEFLFPTASPDTLTFYHGVIRKCAHFTEYAILAVLAMRAFAGRRAILATSLILIGVAAIDEISQSFNPSRTGSATDVVIDLTGGVAAILIVTLTRRRRGAARAEG